MVDSLLIPPIPHLSLAAKRPRHLTLAHLFPDPRYSAFYLQEAQQGAYLILDNSAHETQVGQDMSSLWEIARRHLVSEIVLPDHLFDSEDTVARTQRALEQLIFLYRSSKDLPSLHFMIVPQGDSPHDYQDCLTNLVAQYRRYQTFFPEVFPFPPVIGVSKDYEVWAGGLKRVLQQIIFPVVDTLGSEVHLLGWGRQLWDLFEIFDLYGSRLRSIDSAKPFVYGWANVYLDPLKPVPPHPTRPQGFFQEKFMAYQLEATQHNINVFESLSQEKISEKK